MTTQSNTGTLARKGRKPAGTPAQSGLPDPRPVTDYTAAMSEVGGKSRVTITLSQPCIIRNPLWPIIDCVGGGLVYPNKSVVLSNTSFYVEFAALVALSTAFVQVPYQDMQVQNFQGGFVRPGGQWFREPQMPK